MKKWSEIQQATLNKMFMVLTDINEDVNDYLSKMIYFANEALTFIANDLRPNVRHIQLTYKGNFNFDIEHDVVKEKYNYYRVKTEGTFDNELVKYGDYIYSNGTDWVISKGNMIFEFPDDFISYADISCTFNPNENTEDRFLTPQSNATKINIGEKKLLLPYNGVYELYYYALYGYIPLNLAVSDSDRDLTKDHYDENGKLDFTGIPQSILNVLPSYIASQLQGQDDPQRSAILRNEFELMCSRLDDTNFYNIEGFISEGGWV